tara:strand:+ start:586 stop:744 length:159 start_codon:yes stop_codon:yes gene_type:complete
MTRIAHLQAWLDRHTPTAQRASHIATRAAFAVLGASAIANLTTVFLRSIGHG